MDTSMYQVRMACCQYGCAVYMVEPKYWNHQNISPSTFWLVADMTLVQISIWRWWEFSPKFAPKLIIHRQATMKIRLVIFSKQKCSQQLFPLGIWKDQLVQLWFWNMKLLVYAREISAWLSVVNGCVCVCLFESLCVFVCWFEWLCVFVC